MLRLKSEEKTNATVQQPCLLTSPCTVDTAQHRTTHGPFNSPENVRKRAHSSSDSNMLNYELLLATMTVSSLKSPLVSQ